MYLDKVVAIKHAALDLDLFEWCIIYNENSHKSSLNSIEHKHLCWFAP